VNRFALFAVHYGGERYRISGTAYDERGEKVAMWHSVGSPTFSRDGRELSYEWQGDAYRPEDDGALSRSGLSKLELIDDESGTGRVDHVAASRQLSFYVSRVSRKFDSSRFSPAWERDYGEACVRDLGPTAVTDPARRNALARRLAAAPGFQDVLSRELGYRPRRSGHGSARQQPLEGDGAVLPGEQRPHHEVEGEPDAG